MIVLIANERIGRNTDPAQSLRYFSWALFAVIAVVYSAFVFWLELAKDGPFIFSRNNVRTRSQVLLAHAMFLTILLCCYRICTYMIRTVPFWMTDTLRLTSRTKTSFAEIVLSLAALGVAYFDPSPGTRAARPGAPGRPSCARRRLSGGSAAFGERSAFNDQPALSSISKADTSTRPPAVLLRTR